MVNRIEEELHKTLDDILLCHVASDKFILARHGLRRVRFYMLRHLYQNPGISITRLSTLSFTDVASTSRMVSGLEEKGLVLRKSKEGDRRLFVLSLTDTGKALYEEANADLRVDIQKRFTLIGPNELSNVLQNAQKLSESIFQHRDNQESKQQID
jgi:DNA-binding MarR family transcriptional regulator